MALIQERRRTMTLMMKDVMLPDLLVQGHQVTMTSVHVCRMPTVCSSGTCPSSTLQPTITIGLE
jgi:hypothetical protein